MKYWTLEELETLGISATQAKTAVSLQINNRNFDRKTDIPKKFKDKIAPLCQNIEEAGKEYFVVENSYSYTIWEEVASLPVNTTQAKDTLLKRMQLSVSSQVSPKPTEINDTEKVITEAKSSSTPTVTKSSVPDLKVFVRQQEEKDQSTSQPVEKQASSSTPNINQNNKKQPRKYRGVVIDDNQGVSQNTVASSPKPKKKTVRKYRGAIIED